MDRSSCVLASHSAASAEWASRWSNLCPYRLVRQYRAVNCGLPERVQDRNGPRGGFRDSAQRTQAVPTAEQASLERDRACAEVVRRVGSPVSSNRRVEQQDVVFLNLDAEQFRAILGGGQTVTPHTAEEVV
ncbi:hypothetical protein NDU88_000724 [Pleurodeles waltl]|uniref:Uncharacterized protein n=1 Tax=Pleurodeles waltl TaxID=8319 RepID=A0AAV7NI20_PLEWA|nr:hypothetical protein NDU88_000724 [Pleurodeles waltl]